MTQTCFAQFGTEGAPPPVLVNSRSYGDSGSILQSTGSIASGSRSLILAEGHDFASGHGVLVHGAGPACTLDTPAAPDATATSAQQSGDVYSYRIVALTTRGGYTAAGPAGEVTIAAGSSLHPNVQWISVEWDRVTGAAAYAVFRSINGGAWLLRTIVEGFEYQTARAQFKDYGSAAIFALHPTLPTYVPRTLPEASGAECMLTTITSLVGDTATLADAATTTVEAAMVDHDDSAALRAWLATLTTGRKGHMPRGARNIADSIVVDNASWIEVEGDPLGEVVLRDNGIWQADAFDTDRWALLTLRRSNACVSRLTIQGAGGWGTQLARKGIGFAGKNTGASVEVHHCAFRDLSGEACYSQGYASDSWYVHDCDAFDCRSNAFNANAGPDGLQSKIERCTVTGGFGSALLMGGTSVDIADITIADMGPMGADVVVIAGTPSFTCARVTITGCDVSSASARLLTLGFGEGESNYTVAGVVSDCTLSSNRIDGADGIGAALACVNARGPVIVEGCEIEDNGRPSDTARQVLMTGAACGDITIDATRIGGGTHPASGITIAADVPAGAVEVGTNTYSGIAEADRVIDLR